MRFDDESSEFVHGTHSLEDAGSSGYHCGFHQYQRRSRDMSTHGGRSGVVKVRRLACMERLKEEQDLRMEKLVDRERVQPETQQQVFQ